MKSREPTSFEDFSAVAAKKYRAEFTKMKLSDIELKPSERITLGMGKESKYAPTILKTNDIDELKSWIGTPDHISDTRRSKCIHPVKDWLPSGVVGGKKATSANLKRTVEKLKANDRQKILSLTRAYVYGNSNEISVYKPLLEHYWEKFHIPVWWFRRIYVPSGAVVTLSPGNAGILWAYSIEIEEGGKVLCDGTMTFDVSQIKKL